MHSLQRLRRYGYSASWSTLVSLSCRTECITCDGLYQELERLHPHKAASFLASDIQAASWCLSVLRLLAVQPTIVSSFIHPRSSVANKLKYSCQGSCCRQICTMCQQQRRQIPSFVCIAIVTLYDMHLQQRQALVLGNVTDGAETSV